MQPAVSSMQLVRSMKQLFPATMRLSRSSKGLFPGYVGQSAGPRHGLDAPFVAVNRFVSKVYRSRRTQGRFAAQAGGMIRAIHGPHPPRLRRCGPSLRDVRFGILPLAVNPSRLCQSRQFSSTPPSSNKKGPREGALILFGGGGGNRTPVRRSYVPGSTCLARRLISPCGNTAREAHRRTSRL